MRRKRAFLRSLTIAALLLLPGRGASALPEEVPAPAAGEPYRVGEGITRPEKISGAPPVYTEEARKAGARVIKGLLLRLDGAALKALRDWKFKPAMRDGKPVQVLATFKATFIPPAGVEVEME